MPGARSDREPDPLGKRALFWVPSAEEAAGAGSGSTTVALPVGKRALYSNALFDDDVALSTDNPVADSGSFTVQCKRCCQVSQVGILDLVIYQFPIGIWFPGRRFDHRMTCPACRNRAWCSITLRRR